jgi:hypothetical protein
MARSRVTFMCVSLLLVLACGVLAAQENTGDLQSIYESRKISILPEGAPAASLFWTVTAGFKTINEAQFLLLAGYKAEAEASRKHESLRGWAFGGMIGVMSIGGLLMMDAVLVPMLVYPGSFRMNYTEMIVGGAVLMGGFYVSLLTIRIPPNTIPYGRATQIARSYNDSLIDTINNELRSSKD